MFKTNVGSVDRILRIVLGQIIPWMIFLGIVGFLVLTLAGAL